MIQLVFIHGWGFDARFWDPLSTLLPQFPQERIDLGFFEKNCLSLEGSNPKGFDARRDWSTSRSEFGEGSILIGHSLGFVHGLKQRQDWRGWIAINSFARFVQTPSQSGCVPAASLREMRMRFQNNPAAALQNFYQMIEAVPPAGTPNAQRLREGLDELSDSDVVDRLQKLDVPGLALAGRKDPLVPVPISETLGRMAKDGLMMHDKAGHLLAQSHPGWCAEAIAGFIAKNFG